MTVNAHRGRLPTRDENETEYESFADRMRALAGDLIPPDVPKEAAQASGYPPYLASVPIDQMHRQVRTAGREDETLLPILNIGYSDNAPMVTVGGVIVDKPRARQIEAAFGDKDMSVFLDETRHLKIGVPPLTLKEKVGLDQLLPRIDAPTEQDVMALGFRLKPAQIETYRRFYRYYSMFGEFAK